MNTTEHIGGNPIKGAGDSRIVNLQNCSALYWVYAPTTPGKYLYVSSDSAQLDSYQQWRLILVDSVADTYRIQNVANANYAWVPHSKDLKAGVQVTLSAVPRLWIIKSDGKDHYKIYPEGKDTLLWTVDSSELNAPVTVEEYQGDASVYRMREVKSS